MPLKTGTWKINFGGFEAELVIAEVDGEGGVTGSLVGLPIVGIWDEASLRVSFAQKQEGPANVTFRLVEPTMYTGYLFPTPRNPQPGDDFIWTLAGTYSGCDRMELRGSGGNARRSTFGWFAQIEESQ